MTDKEKEKLHQILSSLWKNDDSIGKTYYNQALQDAQISIDSLQEEPVSEDLNTAAKVFANNITDKLGYKLQLRRAVVYGAKWQKEQLMANAIYGTARPDDSEIWCNLASSNLKDGDKVKVIIIKGE